MVMVQIPSLQEAWAGMSYIRNGACHLASNAVQDFVTSPSIAQTGLGVLAAQIDGLEQFVQKLSSVATGIEDMKAKLETTRNMEWHSPAGQAFTVALDNGQTRAVQLEQTAQETIRLAQHSIEDLRTIVATLQSLVAVARTAVGQTAASAIGQVCA